MEYLWRADVLSGSLHTSRLHATLGIDAHVPSVLDEILDLEDRGKGLSEALRTWCLGTNHVRDEHLDVSVTTEATCMPALDCLY